MTAGSLALHRGALYVGRWTRGATVRAFDLDGAPLEAAFWFQDAAVGRSSADGLAVDDDRHVWVSDRAAGRVRLFTLFGAEIGGLGGGVPDVPPELVPDRAGLVHDPVDVAVEGDSDAVRVLIASGGERRHALQLFGGSGTLVRSLRSLGDPRGRFRRIAGVAQRGRVIAAAEAGARRVQVFRDLEFHFAFPVAGEPTAVALLEGGRFAVAHRGPEGGVELFDAGGRHAATLAPAGSEEGRVRDPSDLAVEHGASDRTTRIFVIDAEGERVQVLTLDGRCYGSFPGLSGAAGLE